MAEGDVPEGSGDGAGAALIEVSAERIFAEHAGTSPTKALTKLIKDKKERKMPKTDTKSPEHREKLRKALKAYWAKRRKEGAAKGTAKPRKVTTKAAPKVKAPADSDAAALTAAAYATYDAEIKVAQEKAQAALRKTILAILDRR